MKTFSCHHSHGARDFLEAASGDSCAEVPWPLLHKMLRHISVFSSMPTKIYKNIFKTKNINKTIAKKHHLVITISTCKIVGTNIESYYLLFILYMITNTTLRIQLRAYVLCERKEISSGYNPSALLPPLSHTFSSSYIDNLIRLLQLIYIGSIFIGTFLHGYDT